MSEIYKLGIVIGIIAIYLFGTLLIGALISGFCREPYNKTALFCVSWVTGTIAFIVLAVFTLEKFGLWM